jgi:hypothetical protein
MSLIMLKKSFKPLKLKLKIKPSQKKVLGIKSILDLIISELRNKLDESYKDFEILGLDWEKLDSLLKSKVIIFYLILIGSQ